MSRCVSALSTNSDAKKAVEEVCAKIDAEVEIPIAILFFAEVDVFETAAKTFYEKYPMATSIGSTTYINIVNSKHSNKGLSALAIFSGLEVSSGIIEDISRHPMNHLRTVKDAMDKLESKDNTICLEFTPAFRYAEELVLDTLNEAVKGTDIIVTGSSAGNNYGSDETLVALNGTVYRDCAVFAFIRNKDGAIATYRENIYTPTNKTLTVTDADVSERRIYEYDDKPAYQAMKEAVGVEGKRAEVEIARLPVGRMEDGEIFITDVCSINDDDSLTYYSRVYNMTKVAVLELGDLDKVWSETAAKCKKIMPNPSFTLAINCAGRTRTIEELRKIDDLTECLSENYGCIVNVSGFGEQLLNSHFNQTLVLVMFE